LKIKLKNLALYQGHFAIRAAHCSKWVPTTALGRSLQTKAEKYCQKFKDKQNLSTSQSSTKDEFQHQMEKIRIHNLAHGIMHQKQFM